MIDKDKPPAEAYEVIYDNKVNYFKPDCYSPMLDLWQYTSDKGHTLHNASLDRLVKEQEGLWLEGKIPFE